MHALHWSALPTPWVSGATSDDPLKIGGSDAWQLPADATAGFLEFTGAGTGQMLEMIQHYETQMAAIGARLLARPTAGAEAAETVRLKSLADTSLLVLAAVECVERADVGAANARGAGRERIRPMTLRSRWIGTSTRPTSRRRTWPPS